MDQTWLTTRADLEAEMAETYLAELTEDWDRLLSKMLPGGELWHFHPPTRRHIQMGGVAIVRSGAIISKVVYWVA